MKTFEIGKTYTSRFITDSNCKLEIKILSRTAKRIKFFNPVDERESTVSVKVVDGVEIAYPLGKYSMAPTLKADRHL